MIKQTNKQNKTNKQTKQCFGQKRKTKQKRICYKITLINIIVSIIGHYP